MDGLTHSLVGLTSAKAGLDRLSPCAITVCVLAANAPDSDIVVLLISGRWSFLQHHRGITHAIVGTLALAFLIPTVFFLVDQMIARFRRRVPRIHFRGLLLASVLSSATHPIMDWTNNYGVRPFLPWSGKWFYGDLVFIVDPYLLLILGGAAFLLTSNRWAKIASWSVIGLGVSLLILLAPAQRIGGGASLAVARTIWIVGILILFLVRALGLEKRLGQSIAIGALAMVILYWGGLSLAHQAAYRNGTDIASQAASQRGERLIRTATMPTPGNPFRWLSVAETDRAMYRFFVSPGERRSTLIGSNLPANIERYEKPTGRSAQLVALAARDPHAQILLGFARFPMARVENENCTNQTLVQFADLRYTEPGATARGPFSLNVLVDCPRQ